MRDLSAAGRLAGFEVKDRFYEVGSPQGLADLERHPVRVSGRSLNSPRGRRLTHRRPVIASERRILAGVQVCRLPRGVTSPATAAAVRRIRIGG
jgi:hypothetical protein